MCRGGERVGEREGEGEGKDAVMATTYIHTCTHLRGNMRCERYYIYDRRCTKWRFIAMQRARVYSARRDIALYLG